MTELENIKLFFSNTVVKYCVKITKVEIAAKLPARTLYSFLKGEKYRSLTPEQVKRVIPVIVELGYKPLYYEVDGISKN